MFRFISGGLKGRIIYGDCALLPVTVVITFEASLEEMMEIRGRPNVTNKKQKKAAKVKKKWISKDLVPYNFLLFFFLSMQWETT